MLNHASICTLAKHLKRSTKDLLVLASMNDPFYADREGRRLEAEWFAEQWERFDFQKGVHTRRIHRERR